MVTHSHSYSRRLPVLGIELWLLIVTVTPAVYPCLVLNHDFYQSARVARGIYEIDIVKI